MASKFKTVKGHFRRRMSQRFGIIVTQQIENELLKQISTGKATPLYKQSLTKSCFQVSLNDLQFAVIYSNKYKTLVTAFPLEWVGKPLYGGV